jgi:hypothetical protein
MARIRVFGIFASTCLATLCSYPQLAAASPFTPPDLSGFNQHGERSADGDADGVKETLIVQYLNANGDSIVSMSTKGRLWAWSLETRGNESSVHNYVIRDSDCDGTFDEVYSLEDQFHIPDCLK